MRYTDGRSNMIYKIWQESSSTVYLIWKITSNNDCNVLQAVNTKALWFIIYGLTFQL